VHLTGQMHIMDGERVTKPKDIRRRHSDAFKRALVERSLVPGASVAAIAQDAGVNANLLFNWRRLHLQAGISGCRGASRPGAAAGDSRRAEARVGPTSACSATACSRGACTGRQHRDQRPWHGGPGPRQRR
jgi:transposase-like protein